MYAAAGVAIAFAPAVALYAGSDAPTPHLTAECQDVQSEGSFSMDCAPTAVENPGNDQLTEQEVAEPGYNGNAHAANSYYHYGSHQAASLHAFGKWDRYARCGQWHARLHLRQGYWHVWPITHI